LARAARRVTSSSSRAWPASASSSTSARRRRSSRSWRATAPSPLPDDLQRLGSRCNSSWSSRPSAPSSRSDDRHAVVGERRTAILSPSPPPSS
jgi:hypothetical protein